MTYFNFIFDSICVPYIFRKSIFGWNCDHDTPLCDTPLLEDTPLCDTPDEILWWLYGSKMYVKHLRFRIQINYVTIYWIFCVWVNSFSILSCKCNKVVTDIWAKLSFLLIWNMRVKKPHNSRLSSRLKLK